MPKKKTDDTNKTKHRQDPNVEGLRGELTEQGICDTLEWNFMPYAMSIIVSRAIPEIDGFKPSHRKLLYTMYKMGLLSGGRTKSANIVGATMRLNPHGDAAIYETMVRLSRGNGALLHPFVDSKGNFGKVYSRDMAYAASRYTEAKLEGIAGELFRDIDFDTVDMVDNYDGTMKEPALLPTTFPNVLVSSNTGIAAGMASNICSFNLREVCETTKAFIRDPRCDLLETLPAPDFPTGGEIVYDPAEMLAIYNSGRGSFKVRTRWRWVKEGNLIEVYEIPYTASTEAIIDKVAELIKGGKIREINDIRDETDLSGLKITIDLKRGVDPDKLMQKLFRYTPLQDSFSCNFNILIAGMPRVLSVREILEEWVAWRTDGIRRRTYYQLQRKKERLHLLQGLGRILLDIDKAIRIIRETESDAEVIPNLMIGFGIDEVQANFVAEIKLRNINKEYILKKTAETADLEKEIADLEKILKSDARVKTIIVRELDEVVKKYGQDRRTGLVYDHEVYQEEIEEPVPDYPVTIFLSKEGYFKKITPQSLRMSGEQKFKEGDSLALSVETTNQAELMVFSNRCQVYKTRCSEFADAKASVLGDYLPQKLEMDEGEGVAALCLPGDYTGFMIFVFEDGKVAKVELSAYATKSNRRKLTGAYSDKSPLKAVFLLRQDEQLVLYSTEDRALLFSTAQLTAKTSRTTQGVSVMTLKKKAVLYRAARLEQSGIENQSRYRTKTIPAAGALLKDEDRAEKQLSLLCGCGRIYPKQYLTVSEHNSPYAYKQETPTEAPRDDAARTPVVSDYYALRSVLSGYVMTGVTHGQVRMEKYRGDAEQDVRRVTEYLTQEDPICAYAIKEIRVERYPTENGWLISVDATYRRSVREIESIEFVRGNEAAAVILQDALNQFQTVVTVRISGYSEEDFVRSLTDYCLENPDRLGMIPRISAAVYPNEGNARVVEVRYSYPADIQTLRTMRSETDSVLASAFSFIRFTEDDAEKLRLIFSYLDSRFTYREDEQNASFYSLLCEGVGSSETYASVVSYLCRKCGMDARIVSGTKDGESWYWNILSLDGVYYHYDFHAAALRGEEPQPLSDEQMEGYEWDREAYPACTNAAERTE